MSNYQRILTSIRKMAGRPYWQPAYVLDTSIALYKRDFATPDRPPFGTSVYEGVFSPSPLTSGIRGVANAPYNTNREFIGVAPVKGVFGGLADGT